MTPLRAARYEMLNTGFFCTMAEGMIALGEFQQANPLIRDREAVVRRHSEGIHLPEVLRIHASSESRLGRKDAAGVLLREAISKAREQGASAWQLRSTLDLIELESTAGSAAQILQPLLKDFAASDTDRDWLRAKAAVASSNTGF
jgi:hypothetical protein